MTATASPGFRASELQSIPEGSFPHNTESFKGWNIKRSDTPETLLTEFSNRPDITIYCDNCAVYIDIRNLRHHKSYHEALLTLNYRHLQRPYDLRGLMQRRNTLVKKLKTDATREDPLKPKQVQKIDDAFEFLKSELEDSYEEIKQIHEKIESDVRGVSLLCSPACAYAVGMCNSENSRWKNHMEDTRVYQDFFGEDRNKCYLAVFDGHHGEAAAERSANEMHHLLLHEMAKFDSKTKSTTARNFADSATARTDYELLRPETRDSFRTSLHQDSAEIVKSIMDVCNAKYNEIMKEKGDEDKSKKKNSSKHPFSDKMQKAFKKTYHLMDILLSYGKDERSRVRWSGTSALTIVIHNTSKTNPEENNNDENKLEAVTEERSTNGSSGSPERAKRTVDPPVELGMIHVANAGSSRALLIRDGKPYRISKDHTPKNEKERERVVASEGKLSSSEKDCRVNGVLSVTRSLGNHGDKRLKDCVIVDPHVMSVPVDQYAQILVLATSGVWDVLSDEEVASLLVKLIPNEQIPPPTQMSDSLLPLFKEPNEDTDKNADNNPAEDRSQKSSQKGSFKANVRKQSAKGVSFVQDDNVAGKTEEDDKSLSEDKVDSGDLTQQNGEKSNNKENDDSEQAADILVVSSEENVYGEGKMNKMVLADLQTEIGSQVSTTDQDRSLLHGEVNGHSEQFVDMEEHTNIPEPVPQTTDDRHRELAGHMAEYLTQAALLAGSRGNITVMVVLLPGCGVE